MRERAKMSRVYVIRLRRLIAVALSAAAAFIAVFAARFAVQTAAVGRECVRVPVLMYHSVLKNANGNKYIITPESFESDLKFLTKNGYTTIVVQDLIDYVYEGAQLPEKPVMLTFDDGHYNNYSYVYPLLQKYNAKAVISIVGAYTDNYTKNPDPNPNYAYLSWDEARFLSDSGYFEIQNHTNNLHSLDKGRIGCKKKRGEGAEAYRSMLAADIGSLQKKCEEHIGSAPTAFTYPFGGISDASLDVIRELGFKASFSCEEGMNELERKPEQLYMLKRCIRTPARRAEDIIKE